ncbi:DUF1990 family protein [Klenkia taihuensis]|uniref:Uncharacterized protein, UPF0548 family n=1 Tax=Klenkia taihuensis TaxID=1225127 RepID=A0A1I1MEZ9_9ACTN|nr:DUF1990 domain-containing protein [Klenkia taihuensis]GHE14247.1 hypothetical protein GCM10011381_40000 [Klenkia taihuensis]SFC84004.1 Uncharacterized protein, UPF0548 family [Klenkia taihuensis]
MDPALAALTDAPFTYPEVGATRTGDLPAGVHVARRRAVVGRGDAAFDRAVAAVLDWAPQRHAGLRVRASGPAGTEGAVVLMTAGLPPLGLRIPCRVVWTCTEGDRQGYAYGTLPGHPESGEESFVVSRDGEDVVFEMVAFSRLATRAARLGGPVSRVLQSIALTRYTAAVRKAARG